MAQLYCGNDIVGMIGVNHEPDIRTDGLAHRPCRSLVLVDTEADLELHRLKTFFTVPGGLFGKVNLRIACLAPVESGRIAIHFGSHRSAHQAMNRLPEIFALEVPKRDIDAAQALDDHSLLAVLAEASVDLVPQPHAPHGVLAQEHKPHTLDDGRLDA